MKHWGHYNTSASIQLRNNFFSVITTIKNKLVTEDSQVTCLVDVLVDRDLQQKFLQECFFTKKDLRTAPYLIMRKQ